MKRYLEAFGRWTVRFSGAILLATVILCGLAIFASLGLGVDTNMANMLPPSNLVARSYTNIVDEFSTSSVLVVVVQGPDRATVVQAAEEFASKLKTDKDTASLVSSVQLKLDRDFVLRWGLLLQDEEELLDTEQVLASTRLLPLMAATNDLMESKLADDSDEEVEGAKGEYSSFGIMARYGLFIKALNETVQNQDIETGAELLSDIWLLGEEYLVDPTDTILAMTVRPVFSLGDRASLSSLSSGAAKIGSTIAATMPGVTFSFTGDIENEAAEERAIGADMVYPSILAIVLICVLFAFSFSRWRSMVFALIALVAGIVLDLGFAALTIRNLNMITSSFGVLLVGLGIDFGIHIASRYDDEAVGGLAPEAAMGRVFSSVGAPILVGGVTTAIAFYSLLLSRTLAFRQFGLVAGTGMICALASSFIVLPALIAWFPGKGGYNSLVNKSNKNTLRSIRTSRPFLLIGKVSSYVQKHPHPVLIIAAILVILSAFFIPLNSFEYDLRRIGPQGTPAQEAENLVAESFGLSTWQNLVMVSSLEEVRHLHKQFEEVPLVRRVESIADYVPSNEEQTRRLAIIRRMSGADRLQDGRSWENSMTEALVHEIQRLEWNMVELGDLAAISLGEDSLPVRKRDAMIREVRGAEIGSPGAEVFQKLISSIMAMPPELASTLLGNLDREFALALEHKVRTLSSVTRAVRIDDVPLDVRTDLVSPEGEQFLVVIQGDTLLDDEDDIKRLAKGLSEIHPETTGTLSLGVELSREILVESRRAAVIVAILVCIVLLVGIRSVRLVVVAVTAFGAALMWTFGLHPLLGKFNIVNALSLPLIMGVGIDYCVHVISALSAENPQPEIQRTVKAITLSALTTIIGFGSLALVGSFEGIAALGRTLSTGIMFCYLAAILVVPALMHYRVHIKQEEAK